MSADSECEDCFAQSNPLTASTVLTAAEDAALALLRPALDFDLIESITSHMMCNDMTVNFGLLDKFKNDTLTLYDSLPLSVKKVTPWRLDGVAQALDRLPTLNLWGHNNTQYTFVVYNTSSNATVAAALRPCSDGFSIIAGFDGEARLGGAAADTAN
jgi:hypothetical protein